MLFRIITVYLIYCLKNHLLNNTTNFDFNEIMLGHTKFNLNKLH